MAKKIDLFSVHVAANKIIKEQGLPLEKHKDSDYYYLTKLGYDDVIFDDEYVKIMKLTVTYTVKGYFASVSYSDDGSQAVTFSSVLNIDSTDGVAVSKSRSWEKIPKEYLSHVGNYLNRKSITTKEIEKLIIADAKSKLKKDPQEPDPFSKMEILESKTKKSTFCSVEWARIVGYPGGEYYGFGYAYEGMPATYYFEPKKYVPKKVQQAQKAPAVTENKEAKQQETKQAKPEKAKPEKAKKSNKPKSKTSFANLFSWFIIGIVLSAVILLLEFSGILIVNKGTIAKTSSGAYTITTENYDKFLNFTVYNGTKVEKLEQNTDYDYVMWRADTSSMQDYPLFRVVPRNSSFNIFDAREKKSLERVDAYPPLKWFPEYRVPKYVISDLYVKCKVTFSYNGVEDSVICEIYKDKIVSYDTDCFINVDLPEESMISETRKYVTNGKGDTTTMTLYRANLDYWSVEILEVGGMAEVKEVAD